MTKIIYFTDSSGKNPIRDFIDSLEKPAQIKVTRLFQTITTYGLIAVTNHIKKLTGTPLYELRILGSHNIRFIYIAKLKDTVVILHGFVKKSQKTPRGEIDLALRRLTMISDMIS